MTDVLPYDTATDLNFYGLDRTGILARLSTFRAWAILTMNDSTKRADVREQAGHELERIQATVAKLTADTNGGQQ